MDYSLLLIFFKKSQWADHHDDEVEAVRKNSREMAFERISDDEGIIREEDEDVS